MEWERQAKSHIPCVFGSWDWGQERVLAEENEEKGRYASKLKRQPCKHQIFLEVLVLSALSVVFTDSFTLHFTSVHGVTMLWHHAPFLVPVSRKEDIPGPKPEQFTTQRGKLISLMVPRHPWDSLIHVA